MWKESVFIQTNTSTNKFTPLLFLLISFFFYFSHFARGYVVALVVAMKRLTAITLANQMIRSTMAGSFCVTANICLPSAYPSWEMLLQC